MDPPNGLDHCTHCQLPRFNNCQTWRPTARQPKAAEQIRGVEEMEGLA